MKSSDNEIKNWENRYQTGDTPWEKGHAAPPLADFLKQNHVSGKILAIGCGSGNDVRALSVQGTEVVGIDFTPSAIQRARSVSPVGKETYIQADLFDLPSHFKESFDWVFEHTCFCAMPVVQRPDYARIISDVLKDDGRFLAIFYINPDHDDGPPFRVSKKELNDLFGPYFKLEKEWVPTSSYPGREGRELMCVFKKEVC